ncbi:MAG: hypothetical protein LUE23_08340, partial [Lachnospiraceae bacterium]|nr:hypothetical protein [Lachnospiraceae bacterium]
HSGGSLLGCSIGISPPRLHCGRAANYGSIMIAVLRRRPAGCSPAFPVGVIAPSESRYHGVPLNRLFKPVMYLKNVYEVVMFFSVVALAEKQ